MPVIYCELRKWTRIHIPLAIGLITKIILIEKVAIHTKVQTATWLE